MRVIQIHECGDVDVLKLEHVPVPQRKAGQVLVKTVSIGVNPVDLIVRTGHYKPEKFPKVGPPCPVGHRQRRHCLAGGCPPGCWPGPVCGERNQADVLACAQVLGGDVAGIVEEADESSKVSICAAQPGDD